MEEEIKELVEESTLKEEVENEEIEKKEDTKEPPKGEDIYVENDPLDLERMLGIAPDPQEEDSDNTTDLDIVENNDDVEENEDNNSSVEDKKDSVIYMAKEKPILLSSFMEEDKESFTYLVNHDGSYHVQSIPISDKKEIKQAVKSGSYIFRYPRFILKDKVLGFVQDNKELDSCVEYTIFFPEYSLTFTVDSEYTKPYSESFKEYFEDLVTRVRPRNLKLAHYENEITISSLKVIETGILEVVTDIGTKNLLLINKHISFHRILDYIRELSDLGEDRLTLKLLPEFFVEI